MYVDNVGFHALDWFGRLVPLDNRLVMGGVQKRRQKQLRGGRCCYSERKFG